MATRDGGSHRPDEAADWFAEARATTEALVRVRSVSPDRVGENAVAEEVVRLLTADGLQSAYTSVGLDPIAGDPFERHNAFAFLKGKSPRTVVLLGHIDTVGTADYGPLEPYATDPAALAAHLEELAALAPEVRPDLEAHPDDWAFGRGTMDMKCGVAATIVALRRIARAALAGDPSPLSVVLLATPDEENESAGVMQAVQWLLRLRDEHGLEYLGAINTDYITARYPGDPSWPVYTGSIGKLLPSFFVAGKESHVGDPFDGLDANLLAAALIADLSMNLELCDEARGQVTPPPVTLHASDLKQAYSAQLPFAASFYLNVLTFTTEPGALLDKLRARAQAVLSASLARIDERERTWRERAGRSAATSDGGPAQQHARTGSVLTYDELRRETEQTLGPETVAAALADEWGRWPSLLDKRERGLRLVQRLWQLSGRRGPAVVLYYSPPYYPAVAAASSPLHEALAQVVATHADLGLVIEEYFPYLADMSYLRLDPNVDVAALAANMPVWDDFDAPRRPGAYTLPFAAIAALGLPVVNLGPYGFGAHQRGERLMMSRSYGWLPRLIYEVIGRLAGGAS
jgi:arginine utilization protein RocB